MKLRIFLSISLCILISFMLYAGSIESKPEWIHHLYVDVNPAVSGATVSLYNGSTLVDQETTDANGRADFSPPGGVTYQIGITKSGYSPGCKMFYFEGTKSEETTVSFGDVCPD